MAAPTEGSRAWASNTIRTTVRLAVWTAAWVGSLALAAFGPGWLWDDEPAPTLMAIGLSVALGIGMLLANKRNLQSLDELQRTIQLEAMGWSLGAGLVGGTAWTLLTRLDGVTVEAEIAHLIVLMSLVYVAAVVAGMLRYR